jgi:hypothetical protein
MQHFDERSSIHICAISTQFAGFEGEDDGTREFLRGALERGDIDKLVDSPDGMTEVEARGKALAYLREQECDISVMWDSDEIVDIDELTRAIAFMEQDQFTAAWRFSYRNLVFNEKTWLAEPFQPMRAHRLKYHGYVADKFYDDNNILYRGTITRDFRHDVNLPTGTISPTIMNPAHYSWLQDTSERAARSRAKIFYQHRRWGHSSFRWDEDKGLAFDEGYYAAHGILPPRVIRAG